MAKFEVKYQRVIYSYKTFIVDAKDEEEAQEVACEQFEASGDDNWEDGEDGDVELQSVELIEDDDAKV